uniref:Uncharacterized protein n=1 Tax=Arundo donax TaxID=35708 RepID=A0A0A9DT36_ARUDO
MTKMQKDKWHQSTKTYKASLLEQKLKLQSSEGKLCKSV